MASHCPSSNEIELIAGLKQLGFAGSLYIDDLCIGLNHRHKQSKSVQSAKYMVAVV
jgi:hypothetical protein